MKPTHQSNAYRHGEGIFPPAHDNFATAPPQWGKRITRYFETNRRESKWPSLRKYQYPPQRVPRMGGGSLGHRSVNPAGRTGCRCPARRPASALGPGPFFPAGLPRLDWIAIPPLIPLAVSVCGDVNVRTVRENGVCKPRPAPKNSSKVRKKMTVVKSWESCKIFLYGALLKILWRQKISRMKGEW